ncbi:DUF2087 domain-containing protein [Staphylococcus americanisciuri]|uniref:DUF2087 domain-containing protein n=1 Tax=Staphylococcus americanisciuri TaxID=2973940 RepID=A0ABT2F3K0_9STAP|nr:DUF2087 domain-containing protein [Staphylococcus americanisciuri]MCS4486950.1 DUF2087 domain-containing protein [Staphylococcus americanisciuri]
MSNLINRFIKNNWIHTIPRKERDKIELFKYLLTSFDRDKVYSEKEVNAILKQHYDDYVLLRRYLVDYSLLTRDIEGKKYKVAEGE